MALWTGGQQFYTHMYIFWIYVYFFVFSERSQEESKGDLTRLQTEQSGWLRRLIAVTKDGARNRNYGSGVGSGCGTWVLECRWKSFVAKKTKTHLVEHARPVRGAEHILCAISVSFPWTSSWPPTWLIHPSVGWHRIWAISFVARFHCSVICCCMGKPVERIHLLDLIITI